MALEQPLHQDRYKAHFIERMSVPLAALALLGGVAFGESVLILVGGVFLVTSWLTIPGRYDLYLDRLVIHYGMLRRSVIHLDGLAEVSSVRMSLGVMLILTWTGGRRVIIRPREPEAFAAGLEQARRNAS